MSRFRISDLVRAIALATLVSIVAGRLPARGGDVTRPVPDVPKVEYAASTGNEDGIAAAIKSVAASAPSNRVQIDVFEEVADTGNWQFLPSDRHAAYQSDVFVLTQLPRKHNDKAVIVDRRTPLLVHAYARVTIPAGPCEILLRSLNAARLYVDADLIVENPFLVLAGDGHNPVYHLKQSAPGQFSMPGAHTEKTVQFQSDGKPHVFSLLALAGQQKRPDELGELVVAIRHTGDEFELFGVPREATPEAAAARPGDRRFNDDGWIAFLDRDYQRRLEWEQVDRLQHDDDQAYWTRRHEWAARVAEERRANVPDVKQTKLVNNAIDRLIQSRLETENVEPTALLDDVAFLRRVTLDVAGVIPTPEECEQFLADPSDTKRAQLIDRLLDSPRWADNWVGYWEHALAENPGLSKPMLNNSGPFRWFIYDSFADNKPFDRFVTELVLMDGGSRNGGPAGFALATNNDAPFASKAYILAGAFLGVEMKCARCHDAPLHHSKQQDLYSLAAMLGRKPQSVPATSTVPASPERLAKMIVKVSLKPGVPVQPHWPFAELSSETQKDVPAELIRNSADSRETLAWDITNPTNQRFAQSIVNRMWKRYLGHGLIEPVQDWESGTCSHPELLAYLGNALTSSGYDLKHVARLILNSQAYQRSVDGSPMQAKRQSVFASPLRRRMSAEQVADSIMAAVGKAYESEILSMNADGRQTASNYLHLGTPRRAWQFVCTSNERDRSSMTLPKAQAVVDLLMAYGWRQDRQEPIHERVEEATPLTPLLLANGVAVNRAIDLSDNGELVSICLENQSVEQLVERLYVRFLGRKPSERESARYAELLSAGYADRATGAPKALRHFDRSPLSWSTHLDPEANRIGDERQKAAFDGDPPTRRLTGAWRQRVEDMAWVLLNSPEFVFIP